MDDTYGQAPTTSGPVTTTKPKAGLLNDSMYRSGNLPGSEKGLGENSIYGMLFAIDSAPCSNLSVLSRLGNIFHTVKTTESGEAEG